VRDDEGGVDVSSLNLLKKRLHITLHVRLPAFHGQPLIHEGAKTAACRGNRRTPPSASSAQKEIPRPFGRGIAFLAERVGRDRVPDQTRRAPVGRVESLAEVPLARLDGVAAAALPARRF
jgi:hypothetical protein